MAKPCLVACLVLGLLACHSHDHSTGGHGHDHGHAHDGPEPIQRTLWNQEVELFIEHAPFVVGEPTYFVTHVTHVDGWLPRTEGEIVLLLSQPDGEPIEVFAEAPIRAGIYIPSLTFPEVGEWSIEVIVPLADRTSSILIERVPVLEYPPDPLDHDSEGDTGSADTIPFLKEQQWRMDFSSADVTEQVFRASLSANGSIQPRAGGEVLIHAPVTGRLAANDSGFPHIGDRPEKGDQLVSLVPRFDQATDPTTLRQAIERARLTHGFAEKELARIKRLYAGEAVSERELHEAELALKEAWTDLAAAESRRGQLAQMERETGVRTEKHLDIYAPLSGTVIESQVVPGSIVAEGDLLFHIIDLSTVWLNIQIPAGDIGRIEKATGAWFEVDGLDGTFEVAGQNGGHLVALGAKIDPIRRTVPLIFELSNPSNRLKIGAFARVNVFTGESETGPAIPVSAVVEEAGQAVAYVQLDGETFERRVLRLGLREGDRIHAKAGVAIGERVVTKGAYQLRLAGASDGVPDHGHAH